MVYDLYLHAAKVSIKIRFHEITFMLYNINTKYIYDESNILVYYDTKKDINIVLYK